ncbi:MAG: metallophosphoesterase [Polyangia bacterium]|nr:metallophosphoesterase [Polyangia bacterium]
MTTTPVAPGPFTLVWVTLLSLTAFGCGGGPGSGPRDGSVSPDTLFEDAQSTPDASAPSDGSLPDSSAADGGQVVMPQCGLLVNGDAETLGLTGWTLEEGDFKQLQGMVLQYPDAYQGSLFFGAGQAAVSVLAQEVDLSSWAAEIDAGGVYLALGGWLRTWVGRDRAFLGLTALDSARVELGSARVGPYQDTDWIRRGAVIELPPATRYAVVRLRGERVEGQENDAYFDALDLCLTREPPPPPPDDYLAPVYLMWASQDGVSVRWETLYPTVGRVEYGVTPALGSVAVESEQVQLPEVRLAGLPAEQTIYYRVAWEGAYGETADFVTAPADGSAGPFTFLVWGDNQDGTATFEGLVTQMLAEGAVFALSVGDTVSSGTVDNYRSQILGPISALANHVPFLVAGGNHERYSDSSASLFDSYYSQPGEGAVAEHCFGWKWGPIYFLLLDSDLSIGAGSDQHACIEEALNSNDAVEASFRVAIFHKPPRIEWWYGGALAFTEEMEAPWIRDTLEPHLESLGVDLVFNGHNHLYAYTPMTAGGITFVTTGGGGGGLDTNDWMWRVATWPQITVTHHQHHYMRVTASGSAIGVEAVGSAGQVLHSFQLTP